MHRHLERLKESFGVITDWEARAWMILQFLNEQGKCRMNTLLQEQHLLQSYAHHLLNELIAAEAIISDEHYPEIHAHYEITSSGKAALQRLREAMQPGFEQFDEDFDTEKLRVAVDTLKTYRHRLECIKLDN